LKAFETKCCFGVFLAAAAFVLWSAGSRFILANNDEGIYLSGAMRLLDGEVPYRDFFYYLPPATLMTHAAALRLLGEKLWAARIPLAFDIGILSACTFWLTARLAGTRTAFIAVFCFLAFETAEYDRLVADHRWDSSAWATLAITLTVALIDSPSRIRAIAAGAAAAMAAWSTTPVALVSVTILAASVIIRRLRPIAVWIATGAAACSFFFVAWLGARSDLRKFWSAILWPATHYSAANRTPYGWVIGGYANLFQGVSHSELLFVSIFLVFLSLPAILPLFGIGWLIAIVRRPKEPRAVIAVMLAGMAALVLSTLPRPDLIHLMYISPIAYALGAAAIARMTVPRMVASVAIASLLMAAVDYWIAAGRRIFEPSIATRVGRVRGTEGDLSVLGLVTDHVRPGDTFFAFPYWPNFYLLTGGRNPTRFAYLQPGMFSTDDERTALAELEANPPRWILYVDTPAESYLRIWPGSDPARLRFPLIEDFIATRYQTAEKRGTFDLRSRK
jgi:4-amino-4-deoxy-L-arabinose transferase-like glycosyltransferase